MTRDDAVSIARTVFPRLAETSEQELKSTATAPQEGLDAQQAKSIAIDQVRLAQLRRLRDAPDAGWTALRDRGSRVAVLSGAGISVDAGFPTFRGAGGEGLWEQVDPMELASVDGFLRNPRRTLEWYCWRRSLGIGAVPTLAHAAIARAQERSPDTFAGVHTQNVDGLHEAAGSRGVNRIHGSIWVWKDPRDHALVWGPSDRFEDVAWDGDRPTVRPGVVMFGDMAPTGVYERAIRELQRADVALVVGTSAQVSTLWPLLHAADQTGALLVEVNPEASDVTHQLGAVHMRLPAGSGVPLALETLGVLDPEDTERLARTPRTPLREVLPSLRDELLADV